MNTVLILTAKSLLAERLRDEKTLRRALILNRAKLRKGKLKMTAAHRANETMKKLVDSWVDFHTPQIWQQATLIIKAALIAHGNQIK